MEAYPLQWPLGYKRTNSRINSKFKQGMEPSDCRFVGTYDECLAFVSEYQNQVRPMSRKTLPGGKEVRYRDVMRSNTLVAGFTFGERLRILFGSGVHVKTDTYLLIPYPFRAESDTHAHVMPTRLER